MKNERLLNSVAGRPWLDAGGCGRADQGEEAAAMHGNKLTHGEYEVEPPRLVDAQVHAVRHAAHLRRELAIQIAAASEIRQALGSWA